MIQAPSGFEPLECIPVPLKEAMEQWTSVSVKGCIKHGASHLLLPSGDELYGAVPEKFQQYKFELLRQQCFPERGTPVQGLTSI
jgi:hypothetical protein